MTNAELVDYYTNLLILQYRCKNKAPKHIKALMEQLIIFEILRQVENGYDVETAVGHQQDILSKYIGTSREVTGTSFSREYFGFVEYGASLPVAGINPMIQYADPVPDVQVRRYEESTVGLFELNDEELRFIQKLKIVLNNSNLSTRETDDFVTQLFSGQVVFNDRFNMTISYIFPTVQERLVTIARSQGLIPKAMAVGITVAFIEDPSKMFSFQEYGKAAPSYAVGMDEYGDAPSGGWLGYGT